MYMVNYYKVRKYFNSFHLQVDEENSIYVREYGKKKWNTFILTSQRMFKYKKVI